ncbi:MAG: T9SS type A sorting domain-containing protein [Rhodothermales bacterium]|nr:T9SS type A sorting domain-containing protein [Rhodothermales bacterium]MBO6778467.1 T9SS type A sorting domain-containing protein [Rhodothermales bacterium]
MHTSTKLARGLFAAFLMLAFTSDALAQRNVTLTLNTATAADTLNALDEIQIRGQLGSGTALPGGGVIDWNDATTLKPTNVGGDYWEINFQIPENDDLQFKFYSQLLEDDGLGGWEDGDNHMIAGGTGDVVMPLHYFRKGSGAAYDWRPFEAPAGQVAVHYRVFACTEDGSNDGYVPSNPSMFVGVRGAPEPGVLDWGATNVVLSQESDVDGSPGWDIWSGTAFYDEAQAGNAQEYKFVVETDVTGWEDSNNRTFTIPSSDTTLAWVYYGDSNPTSCSAQPETSTVIFSVDLTPLQDIGLFDKARGDTLQVRGGFNGWSGDNPDRSLLLPFPGTNIFEAAIPLTALPGSEQSYKFFIDFNNENFIADFGADPPSGWEEPLSTTGANRVLTFEGDPNNEQFLGDVRFNDVLEDNVIPAGTSIDVTFNVDMSGAASAADPFDPATHVPFPLFGDPIFSFTQGWTGVPTEHFMSDPDGDGVYSVTITINGPTYSAIQYTYAYGVDGDTRAGEEAGGGFDGLGRRRSRFVVPNSDGSWPAAQQLEVETYQPDGALPFETNPAVGTSIETIGDELPQRVELSQNFPNPFNPTTSFEYSLTKTADVQVQVFDVLGRVVATLVDGVQQPATYRLSFDASSLASGTYIYRLTTPTQTLTRTMVLLK